MLQCKPAKICPLTLSEVTSILHCAAVQISDPATFGGSAVFSTAPQCKPAIYSVPLVSLLWKFIDLNWKVIELNWNVIYLYRLESANSCAFDLSACVQED